MVSTAHIGAVMPYNWFDSHTLVTLFAPISCYYFYLLYCALSTWWLQIPLTIHVTHTPTWLIPMSHIISRDSHLHVTHTWLTHVTHISLSCHSHVSLFWLITFYLSCALLSLTQACITLRAWGYCWSSYTWAYSRLYKPPQVPSCK